MKMSYCFLFVFSCSVLFLTIQVSRVSQFDRMLHEKVNNVCNEKINGNSTQCQFKSLPYTLVVVCMRLQMNFEFDSISRVCGFDEIVIKIWHIGANAYICRQLHSNEKCVCIAFSEYKLINHSNECDFSDFGNDSAKLNEKNAFFSILFFVAVAANFV